MLELSRTGAVEALRKEHRGVVHQHVHRAELILGGRDHALAVAGLGQVRRHGQRLEAAPAELRGEGIELGRRARGEHQLHAFRGQGASDVRPQPMGRARDEGGAACEVAHDRGELPAMTAPRNHLRRSYRNTSSATSTRPNGALTCTPCTARFTC